MSVSPFSSTAQAKIENDNADKKVGNLSHSSTHGQCYKFLLNLSLKSFFEIISPNQYEPWTHTVHLWIHACFMTFLHLLSRYSNNFFTLIASNHSKTTKTATKARPTSALKRPSPVNRTRNGPTSVPTRASSVGARQPRVSMAQACTRLRVEQPMHPCIRLIVVQARP